MQIPILDLTFFSRIRIPSVPNLPRKETLDLSMIADRVNPQTWSLFQALRTRMRQLKGVSMKVLYEKHSSESTPAFFYEGRQLYHLHLRGSEMSATFHTDFKSRLRLTENQTIDWRLRDEIRKRTWAGFAFQSSKDLGRAWKRAADTPSTEGGKRGGPVVGPDWTSRRSSQTRRRNA